MLTKLQQYLQKMNLSKLKKIALIAIPVFLVCIFACFLIIKKMSYSLIENNLSNFLGVKIELINPKTTFNAKLDLKTKAEYINIYDKTKTKKFVSIKNLNVEIKTPSLIFKKINIKNLKIEDISLFVVKNDKNEFDILKSLNIENIKKIDFKKTTLTRLNAKINNINAICSNENNTNDIAKVDLENTEIYYSKRNKSLLIKQTGKIDTITSKNKTTSDIFVDIDTKLPIEDKNDTNSKFEIQIKNMNLSLLDSIFKKYISQETENLSGTANLTVAKTSGINTQKLLLVINEPKITLTNKKIINPYKTIQLETLFNINKDTLSINDFKLFSNELNISANGKISKIFSKNPQLDIETKISNTQLNHFTYLIPDNLIPYRPQGIPTLKRSNFFATLDGNINLKLFPLDITGTLKASDIHIPNFPKPSRKNDVSAFFMKDKMHIYTRIYTPQGEYVTIDGISNLDNSLSGKYDVKSTQKIDLAFAKLYLVPVQQIIGFNIGPVPIMDIKGTGNINIKTNGTVLDAQIFGTFNAQNASAKIQGLDANLTNGDCKLIFDNKNLIFKEIKGKLDGSDFLLTGIGNTKGEVDLNTSIQNIATSKLLNIFKNSAVSAKYSYLTEKIAATSGNSNAQINLKGIIKDYETQYLLNDLAPSGYIELKNNKIILTNKLKFNNINSKINFGETQNVVMDFVLGKSKINFKLFSQTKLDKISKKEPLDIKCEVSSNELNSQDITETITNSNLLSKTKKELIQQINAIKFATKFHIKSQGKISIQKLDFSNLHNEGYIVGINKKENNVKFDSGLIKLANNKVNFDNFEIEILGGKIKFNGNISNYLTKTPQNNFFVSFKDINLENMNFAGKKIKFKNSTLNSGLIVAKKDELKLNSFNFNYQNMPLFLNAQIKDLYSKKTLNANFSTILNEQTIDSTINTFLVTPIKIKNEIPIKGTFNGQNENYSLDFTTKLPKNSDLSFGGSNIGDTNYDREISGKIEVNKDVANIKNLKLVKFIKNQNNKVNAMILVKSDGKIKQKNNEIFFENFRVLTHNPTNVRILNLIFKKSLLKKGNFECNLNVDGNIKSPKANGKLLLSDLDIPLYDAEVKNVRFNFSDRIIDGEIIAQNKQSDVKINVKAKNDFSLPFVIDNIDIASNKLNIKEMLSAKPNNSAISDITPKQEPLKLNDFIIKKGTLDFKDVSYDKINAQNLKSDFSYDKEIFDIKSAKLNIANGIIEAKGTYNTKTSNASIEAKMNDCEANVLSEEFLSLQNQIFGKINGFAKIRAKVTDGPENIKGIKSEIDFSIANGKMPKLGSLEYLLRAGNLIKSGIFGLSLNNLIQVLTPYKTGEFEKISGNLQIEDAKIKNLEIYSKGKNLSLFLEGEYNILENFANIKIYGKLSQNISNALGKIGNASLNQFFNAISDITDIKSEKKKQNAEKLSKIPSIETENQTPRYFRVKVLGDINKENYIKSFNWE